MRLATIEKQDEHSTPHYSVIYKLDVFRGAMDSAGAIIKVRSVGHATLGEGSSTIHMNLKTLLKDKFFLLPEQSRYSDAHFAILTREDTRIPGRKFFWHRIGDAYRLTGINSGLLDLQFDLLGPEKIYLDLRSMSAREEPVKEESQNAEIHLVG